MNYTAAEIVKVMHTKVVDMSELVVLLAELARDKWCTARWNKSSVYIYYTSSNPLGLSNGQEHVIIYAYICQISLVLFIVTKSQRIYSIR